ncbi:DUF3617 family protein [Sphingosinicella sp. BN140058]|uniref:DUF3617 domain-containing protein n=1 Tax=Sphingosinicella sp. BN140058 TaxID=1892855 RepID=UPI001013ACDE|nr:DUF3617 family protein [Sphingosinicella sp. BN140058]QAY76176.1 DUF3617 family protein [Sphingosinicella sp. BN140058]
MRRLMLASLCLVAGCGAAEEKKAEAPAAAAMGAGQWETAFETTAFRSTDGKTPMLKAAVGDKATSSACIAAGTDSKPEPAVLVGPDYKCSYQPGSYVKSGRINAQLTCTRGGKGPINVSISGTSTADTLDATAETTSYLPGDGDFTMKQTITAKRTGPTCQAPAPGADGNQTADKAA